MIVKHLSKRPYEVQCIFKFIYILVSSVNPKPQKLLQTATTTSYGLRREYFQRQLHIWSTCDLILKNVCNKIQKAQ